MGRRWQIGVLLAALALIATACGDDADISATSTSVPPAATTGPVTPPTTAQPSPPAPPTIAPPPGRDITVEVARADVSYVTATVVTDGQLVDLVQGNIEFALDLLRSIGTDHQNAILSPFSIAAALTMSYAGARDVTAHQMSDVLHLALPDGEVHQARNELTLRIGDTPEPRSGDDREPLQISVANSLWGQRGFAFESQFLEILASAYDAGVRLVDFVTDAEGARENINAWVAEQTEDRIVDLLPPGSINVDSRLVLTNAIWFKASWVTPFDADSTAPGAFHLLDGSEVTVPMMHGEAKMPFATGDGYRAARLGYAGDAAMLLIAPDPGRFDEIIAALDATFLSEVESALSTHMVDLGMPSFEFKSQLSLRGVLMELGMPDAFDPVLANLSGISSERDDLVIQDVVHQAFISVDEAGTEAAAATAVTVGVTSVSPPATLTLDNPFVFLIQHGSTGEILFAGMVTNPA